MSLKECDEKKEVSVKTRRTACDLCGNIVAEGSVNLRMVAVRNDSHDYGPASPNIVDICNSECMRTNLSGLLLLLQSKIVPNVPEIEKASSGLISPPGCEKAEKAPHVKFSIREIASSIKLRY
jgi:hypothetical protein